MHMSKFKLQGAVKKKSSTQIIFEIIIDARATRIESNFQEVDTQNSMFQ